MDNVDELPNLASAQLGSKIVFATDEWFAAADNMLQDGPAVWKADLYTDYGKWMDGWESRRRRTEGHDWCLVKLGLPASRVVAIEFDTAFFTGNFSPKVSVQGVYFEHEPPSLIELAELRESIAAERPDGRMGLAASQQEVALASAAGSEAWPLLVPLQPLGAGYEDTRRTVFKLVLPEGSSGGGSGGRVSHLRVNMGPDGGIARLRVYGQVFVHPSRIPRDADIDLAAVEVGGRALACSNAHYGHPRNLVAPGRGTCMGDGWETARQPLRPPCYERGADGLMVLPGFDWALLQLGIPGRIASVAVDTHFYRGNYPESCLLEACCAAPDSSVEELQAAAADWQVLLPRTRLGPSATHVFTLDGAAAAAAGGDGSSSASASASASLLRPLGAVTHVRLTIYPDGGVMRLRLNGRPSGGGALSKL